MRLRERDLPEGWEILYAAHLLGGRVNGKVRLQKIISEMQKVGFPVDYYFVIHNMGPYSTQVETDSLALERVGLIKIVVNDPLSPSYRERYDYILTEKGKKFLEEDVIPNLRELSEYKFLKSREETIKNRFENTRVGNLIIEDVHKELSLDDKEEFKRRLKSAIEKFRVLNEGFSSRNEDYCLVFAGIKGLVELSTMVLEEIVDEEVEWGIELPVSAGKYFILCNVEEVDKFIEELMNNYSLPECISEKSCVSESWNVCREVWDEIVYYVNTIEHLSDVYRILPQKEEGETSTLKVLE